MSLRSLRLIPGEYLVERIENVEDTKGNNGDKGMLRITNIRLIWHANAMPRINLSIGYNSVHGVTTRVLKSVSFLWRFLNFIRIYKEKLLIRIN